MRQNTVTGAHTMYCRQENKHPFIPLNESPLPSPPLPSFKQYTTGPSCLKADWREPRLKFHPGFYISLFKSHLGRIFPILLDHPMTKLQAKKI